MIPMSLLSEAKKKGKIIAHDDGIEYIRFRGDFKSISRGTVITKSGRIIWGYPHIKRIFTLEKGIDKNIKTETFYVEEKIDGFNVRVASIDKEIFAFSRGGFIDHFSTENVRKMKLEMFFKEHPQYVLCGEMTGATPYTKCEKIGALDVNFFVFDIDGGDGAYLKPKEKYELLKRYNIKVVPLLGHFNKSKIVKLKQAVLQLSKRKYEGVVIKPEDGSQVIKYVTPYADIIDIANNIELMFDMPSGFFMQRVLRSAYFIRELELDRAKYSKELGQAFYSGLVETLKKIENGENVAEDFEILIKNPNTWNGILKNMSREVKIEVINKKETLNGIIIKFRKIYRRSDKILRNYLAGGGVTD